jgi:hypothetical protein
LVIVAVYVVLYARTAAGVSVAVLPEDETAPAIAVPPGPVSVKVELVIVAGLIAMLKVAVTVVLTTTSVAPWAGVTDTTPGMVTVSWPHPAIKTTNRDARKHVIPILYLRICNLSSDLGGAVSTLVIHRLKWKCRIV